MKRFKKFIAFALIACVMLSAFSMFANAESTRKAALPLSAGLEALRGEFTPDIGGDYNGFSLDYSYYSPVGNNDTNKYPIVIYIHGIGHGSYVGSQLDDSTMPTWASAELQGKWTNAEGAFILLPRCPEEKGQYWNKSFVEPLRALIDSFIEKHKENVDTTRIFVGGSSAGGEMTWDLAIAYPEYFAGIYPLAATGTRTTSDIQKVKDVAIWVFASKLDPLVNYTTNVLPQWEKITEYSSKPHNCRLSSFDEVLNPDGTKGDSNHRLFTTIMYDFFTVDGEVYPNVTTVNGNGYPVLFKNSKGIISWMSDKNSGFGASDSDTGTENDTDSSTESGSPISIIESFIIPIRNFFLKMANIVQKFLGFV